MKITMYMIRDYLGKAVIREQIRTSRSAGSLEGVSVFIPGAETRPDKLYIVERQYAAAVREKGCRGALLFLGGETEIPGDLHNDWLLLSGSECALILQKVQMLFEEYGQWEIELYQAAMEKKGIKQIAMTAAPRIRNPFFLYTSSMKLIFCCNLTDKDEQFFREREDFDVPVEGAYMEDSFLNRLDPERWKNEERFETEISRGSALGYRTLSYRIYVGGIYVAMLLVCETQYKLTDKDFFVLKTLGDFLKPFLEKKDMAVNAHSVSFDKYIHMLLKGEEADEESLQTVLEAFGWREKDRYFCCYLPADSGKTATDSIISTCFFLETACLGSAVITFNDHIVHILNLTAAGLEKARLQQTLVRLYRENRLEAGSSPEFSGIRELEARYRQAKAAYRLGSGKNPERGFYAYEDYRMDDLLRIITGQYPPEVICPKELERLMEYDLANDMHLTLVLKTYLQNDRNTAKSIRILYMQRSTFLYQLKRALEITGLDLDDYGKCLYLQLYFAAAETYS